MPSRNTRPQPGRSELGRAPPLPLWGRVSGLLLFSASTPSLGGHGPISASDSLLFTWLVLSTTECSPRIAYDLADDRQQELADADREQDRQQDLEDEDAQQDSEQEQTDDEDFANGNDFSDDGYDA
jgi:hypothetical protein